MTLVVDASAAIKWVVAEAGRAEVLQNSAGEQLVAPDFVLVEAANILWKKVRRNELGRQQATDAYEFVRDAYEVLVPTSELSAHALRLALDLDHPAYDCLYLACAGKEGAKLLTADRRLADIASRAGIGSSLVSGDAP